MTRSTSISVLRRARHHRVGIVATLATDIWQRLLRAIAGLPPARWQLIGRWVAGFPRGVFAHQSITMAASVRGEAAVGWVFQRWASPGPLSML